MPRKKGQRQPSPRRCLIRELACGKSRREAERLAGYSTKNPGQSAYQALKVAAKSFPELMEEHGLTDDALIEKYLKPLMSANLKKFFQYKGKVKDSRKVPALDTRTAALEMAFRLKGSFAPPAVEQKSKQAVSVIVLDVPRPPRDNPPPTVIELATSDGNEAKDAELKQAQRPELGAGELKPTNNGSKK